jgi:ACS family hexuronate transporter-like MFS transporter
MPRYLSPTKAWMLALAATLTMAVSYFDRQTLAVLAPTVTKALAISDTQYGLLVSAFSLAYLVGSPLAGLMIDRVGARRGLFGAVVLWTIVAALHMFVPGFGVLFVLRLALGLTEAPSFPGASQTVQRALPPASRARGFGVLFTGSSLGALIAPIAASKLAAAYGWRPAFFVTAAAGIVWLPIWWLVTRDPECREMLDTGKLSDPERSETYREQAAVEPPPPPKPGFFETLANPAVLRAAIVVLASAPLAGFVLNWAAKYLATVEHVVQADMGRYLWMPPVIYDLGSIGFGHFASAYQKRHGKPSKQLFVFAGVLASTLPLATVVHGPRAAMLIAGIALAGVAGLFTIFTADMMSRVSPNAVSTAGGITAAAQSLVYVIANPLVGVVVGATGSYVLPIVVLSLLVMPGVILWCLWEPAKAAAVEAPAPAG